MSFATRFAPSPTGRLHLGHAFSALTAFDAARAAGGRFILRIEDIDATRCRPEFEAGIFEDLAWLGIRWEEPVRRQSEHMADYHAALDWLTGEGLTYRCFRTRREVAEAMASAPHGPVETYVGKALPPEEEAGRLADGELFAWRLSLAAARAALGPAYETLSYEDADEGEVYARPDLAGDIVLARKDVGVAYHLAAVVDDHLQAITQVIRGEDLREAADIQRLLQALLGMAPPTYRHHRLILGEDGKRLAKRNQAATLADLRAQGVTPAAIRASLGL